VRSRAACTIAWRDFRSAFESPLAYVLIAAFLAVSGLLFSTFLLGFSDFSETVRQAAIAQGDLSLTHRISLDRGVVTPTLNWIAALLLLLVPLLTMRALAEEKRQGTMELLMTAPVSPASIVLGKFLGALGIACAAIALTVTQPLILSAIAAPDAGALAAGYLGLFLVAAALTSLGILASALTGSPVAAAFLGGAFMIATVLLGVIGSQMQSNLGLVLAWFSPFVHFGALADGVVDVADLAYFAIVVFAALFAALRVVDSERWR
jgi:ABC-2 type transport system permease protein